MCFAANEYYLCGHIYDTNSDFIHDRTAIVVRFLDTDLEFKEGQAWDKCSQLDRNPKACRKNRLKPVRPSIWHTYGDGDIRNSQPWRVCVRCQYLHLNGHLQEKTKGKGWKKCKMCDVLVKQIRGLDNYYDPQRRRAR